MKILHIQGAAQLAGCERTCEMFISALPKAQHLVAVLGSDGAASGKWREAGAAVTILGNSHSRLKEYFLMARTARDARPDAVILWTPSRLGIKVAACQHAGVRKIISHVGNPIRLSTKNTIAAEFYAALPGARKATLIPVSKHVEHSYHGKGGFKHFKSHLVYNAISIENFSFDPLPVLPSRVRVGMIARLDPIKDHATLLRAWKLVSEQRPEWQLELAGDGVLRSSLEQIAATLGIQNRMKFLGSISNIPEVISKWSIVVHSTTREEGLGNSMLEAMAIGRPLVATCVGPVPEVTDNGRLARMCHEGDAENLAAMILDVETDWPRSRNQVVAARQWVEQHFSPQEMVNEYMQCLGMEMPN